MKKVSGPQVVTPRRRWRVRCLRGFRRRWGSWWGRRGRVARAERRCRASVVHELMEAEVERSSARRASTTRIGRPSATGTSAGR